MPLNDLFGLINPGGLPIPASNLPNIPFPTAPGTNIFGGQFGQAGGPGGVTGLFQDRNFLSMLAGMGGRFGQGQSAGEAIGGPAMRTLAALSSQEALQGAEAKREAFNKQILSILGQLTPAEEEGFTGIKGTSKGVTLDLTPPIGEAGKVDPFEFNFTDPRTSGGGPLPAAAGEGLANIYGGGIPPIGGATPPVSPNPTPTPTIQGGAPGTQIAQPGLGGGQFKFTDIAPF